jgi:adenine deaminase
MVRLVTIAAVLLLGACAAQAPSLPRPTQIETRRAIEYDYDILIKGGTIYDGSGGKPYVADIGVKDGLINAVYPKLKGDAAVEIDARGRAVAPGFIGGGDLASGYAWVGRCGEQMPIVGEPLAQAVRRLTSERAAQLGLKEHGRIMPGWGADLVVFDARAGLSSIEDVIIDGVMALDDRRPTGRASPHSLDSCG